MRWVDQSPRLPVQRVEAVAGRDAQLDAALAEATGPTSEPANDARGITVAIERAALDAALAHLGQHPDEQGGLLLGEVFAAGEDPAATRVIVVTQAVPSRDFDSTGISLRMEAGVWSDARARLGERELVVGWYHSHPGLGAFFSGTDRRTQRAFFPHAYSVGWVVDPLRGEAAVFVGAESEDPARVVYCAGAAPPTGGAAAGGGDGCGAEGAGA
jgi:proteasome lid subunit RPN8/RPN11